jgi:predicted NAD/FAD-binding protein
MKIAVLGAGISGLGSAYLLSQKHEVDLYEKEGRLGGHARTTMVNEGDRDFGVDTGFLVFNHETYPLLTKLFKQLNIKIENSEMSFGFWDEKSNTAYNGNSLGGMFLQKKNLFSLSHFKMIGDIIRFNKQANKHVDENSPALNQSLGDYLQSYSDVFKERYLLPMGAAIWSTPSEEMHDFPARTFLQFFKNHGLLGVTTQHQWLTVSGGSINYVNAISQKISGEIILNSPVQSLNRDADSVILQMKDGSSKRYDKVVMAMHAPDALALINDPSAKEKEVLSCFSYKQNQAVLHNDTKALYPDRKSYAAWNYKTGGKANAVTLSYWINVLQNLTTDKEYFVSLNETQQIDNIIEEVSYEHPQFDAIAIRAQTRHEEIDGTKHTYFAGAYWRYGFHEDGLWSAERIAKKMGCAL